MTILVSSMKKSLIVFLTPLIIWSCSDDERIDPANASAVESGPRTYVQAEVDYDSLRITLMALTTTEGLTREKEFPTTGIVIFTGVHSGNFRAESSSGPNISYVSDVVLTLDFVSQKFTGRLTNFSTNLEGFENPEGMLNVSGVVRNPDDLGGDEYGLRFRVQDGNLAQGERTAIFDAVTSDKGRFYGDSAQFIALGVASTFEWTAGPETGMTSGTSGRMYVEME